MESLRADAEKHGAKFMFSARVLGGEVAGADTADCPACCCLQGTLVVGGSRALPAPAGPKKALQFEDVQTGEQRQLLAQWVVNAAGLWAQVGAAMHHRLWWDMRGCRCSRTACDPWAKRSPRC